MNAPTRALTTLPALFDHQNEALSGAVQEIRAADRCKVLMACGTGKTLVAPAIAIANGARTVVVYLPSLALIRQSLPQWIASPFLAEFSYLCVCSDKTVASQPDEAIITNEELEAEFGKTAVTTDSAVVREFLSLPLFGGVRVIFSTYQSSDVVRDGCPEGFAFDLGIFDEAHRTAGTGGMFSAPLLDSHTSIAKRVFMTATPKHYNYRKRDKDGEARVDFSMDDELIYGRVAYNLPIRRAIERGIIADYKVIVSVIDDKRIERESLNGHVDGSDAPLDAEQIAHAIAIRDAMHKFGVRKVVTFHNTVAEADGFTCAPAVQRELAYPVFHVNGNQAASMRSEILGQFAAAPRAVVTNARCLTEGVDVPEIDMVAFLHPKKSCIDIIQAIGRALRLPRAGEKTTGYILLPLYVSEIENGQFEAALKEFGYDTIWQVIEALREHDEVVEMQIREATGAIVTGEPVNLDFIDVIGPAVHLDLLRSSISTMCIEALGESWDEMYGVLAAIWRETGDANVPQDLVVDGRRIGLWLSRQRRSYKNGTLSAERIARLEAIGFVWNTLEASWEENFALLERIARETGNANVPCDLVVDGRTIGSWLSNQRRNYKEGTLSAERVARLQAIGVVWDQIEASWEEHYALVERTARETGNANVPQRLVVDGRKIGIWLNTQRRSYKNGTLSAERIARLEAIGVVWDPLEASWEEHYALVERTARETGNANVPQRLVVDGRKIGIWLNTQRRSYKNGTLSAERIARLEAIGVKW